MLQNVNAHKNEQRKCNVCTRKNNNRAKLKPERDARGRAERESASGNYDFGSLLLLFFLAYFGRKTQKKIHETQPKQVSKNYLCKKRQKQKKTKC